MKKFRPGALFAFCFVLLALGGNHPLAAQSTVTYLIKGKIFLDTTANCAYDTGEPPVSVGPAIFIKAESFPSGAQIGSISEDDVVDYIPMVLIQPPGDTLIRVYTVDLNNFNTSCPLVFEFPLPGVDTVFTVDFPIGSGTTVCPQMLVDISGAPPRPCFDRDYVVKYCNAGLLQAADAYVDVKLDPYISLQSSSVPGTPQPDNTWRFGLEDVPPFECGQFTITYQLDCAVPIGKAICSEAVAYPDNLCPPAAGWNGARVIAEATCEGDSVRLKLTNISDFPTSNDLEYIIVEDIIMYRQELYQLGPQEILEVAVPANGATWHISSEQEPGYPGGVFTSASTEGCGTNQSGGTSTGIFFQYPFSPGLLNRSNDCQAAVSSYDSNSKHGLPVGFGASHQIRAGDEIEYRFNFQNIGNDTAYTVEVRETLPAGLDPTSVIPGAASHPYTFFMNQNGELTFSFPQINLPDSTADLANSSGFVTYRARSFADLPDGSVIAGAADIFFDFNAPITTNVVFHTIGEEAYLVHVNNIPHSPVKLSVFPNPGTDFACFELENPDGRPWHVDVFDALGRPVRSLAATGHRAMLPCRDIAPGLYFFRVRMNDRLIATGSIIIH